MSKFKSLLSDLEQAVKRLEEALVQPKTDIVRDSAIKRFEICFDLSWKTVKAFLEEKHGVAERSPKGALRAAYQHKLIEYDDFWMQMADLRNETVHTYNQETAERVYSALPETLKRFEALLEGLRRSS